jgi:hypothetical protein
MHQIHLWHPPDVFFTQSDQLQLYEISLSLCWRNIWIRYVCLHEICLIIGLDQLVCLLYTLNHLDFFTNKIDKLLFLL